MGTRSLLARLTASAEHLDATELQAAVEVRSCMPMCDTRRGHRVKVVGRLRSVTYTPSETVPTLEAELFDGTDSLVLVWLGQRRIPGVEPGRRIVAQGRVGLYGNRLAIYNPRYELLPAGSP